MCGFDDVRALFARIIRSLRLRRIDVVGCVNCV